MSNLLEYIASYDDLIQFCGTDVELAKKHKNVFSSKESRDVTFDPYLSCASNPDTFSVDIWTTPKTGKASTRKEGTFDVSKYTTHFIQTMKAHLEDTEKPSLKRKGFDAYAYLMAYEEDIKHVYKNEDLTLIQRACLHFIEIGNEEKPVDYLRYMASYPDVIIAGYQTRMPAIELNDWLEKFAEHHYTNAGLEEIISGKRKVDFIFDATRYIATYVPTKDMFIDKDTGSINERTATLAYITVGVSSGLQPDLFNPHVFLSNYPELLKEDIYVKDALDGELSVKKISKIWIDKFPHNIDLSKFDAAKHRLEHKLEEGIDVFKHNVELAVKEYQKELKLAKSMLSRMWNSMKLPKLPKLSLPTLSCMSKKSEKFEKEAKNEESKDEN